MTPGCPPLYLYPQPLPWMAGFLFRCKFAFAASWKRVCCRNHPSSCIRDPNFVLIHISVLVYLFLLVLNFLQSRCPSGWVLRTTSSRQSLEKVYRLLKSSILGLLKSGRECLHHPPKSSYPDLPSPKGREQTPAGSIMWYQGKVFSVRDSTHPLPTVQKTPQK